MSTGMSSSRKILFANSLCNATNIANFHLKYCIETLFLKITLSGSTQRLWQKPVNRRFQKEQV
jgi:hypothetical protein